MGILEIYDDTKFYPAAVALEVTLRCNMRYLHCGSSAGENKEGLGISHGQYKELVEFICESQKEEREGRISIKTMPADSIGYCHSSAIDVWDDLEWGGCNAGRYVIGIQSNGNVSGCLSLQHDSFIVGNVRKRNLKDIREDNEAFSYTRGFRKDKLCGSCKDCSKGDECNSGCLAMGYSSTGELYNNPYCYKNIVENTAHGEPVEP